MPVGRSVAVLVLGVSFDRPTEVSLRGPGMMVTSGVSGRAVTAGAGVARAISLLPPEDGVRTATGASLRTGPAAGRMLVARGRSVRAVRVPSAASRRVRVIGWG
jgi:hypothetical protein